MMKGVSDNVFSLGQRIRELRLKKGITQVDLSKGVCTPSMVSQIESDRARPSYKILFSIADKLDVPLEKLLSDVDLNLEYLSNYKMSRAMVAAKEYASAIPLLKDLLETPRGQLSTTDILFELGECYLHVGELEEAERTFLQLQEIAVLRSDSHLQALLFKNIALIEFQRKRPQLAIYQWQRALDEVEKMEQADRYLKATILFNLGLVNKSLGCIKESISFYQQAADLLKGTDNLNDLANVYLGLGVACRKIGDLDRAADYAERATSIFESLSNLLLVVKTQVSKASLLARIGQEGEALEILEEAIAKLKELGNREEEGIATVELAKLKLQTGEIETAEDLCQRARNLLPELHLYQGWINRMYGEIALLRNQRETAIKRFHKAADCFKQMEEVGEWDGTMYEIARLHVEENDLIGAYGILDDIRRYSRQVLEERGIEL